MKNNDGILNQYHQYLEQQGRAPRTVQGYIGDLQLFARWLEQSTGEPFSPDQVVPMDTRSYQSYMQTVKKLAPATINRRIQSLRSFFRWACAHGIAEEDPTADVTDVTTTRRQFAPKSLTKKQEYRLLRKSQQSRYDTRNYAMLQLMLQAGLRISEVANLHCDDIELGKRSGRIRIRASKGGKEREVPLNARARRALREYLEVRPGLPDVPFLFVSQKGGGMTTRGIRFVVEQCVQEAGLEGEEITPHSLRHTFAARYLEEYPGQLVELAALLGHSSVDTTAIYTQPSFEDVAQRLEGLGQGV